MEIQAAKPYADEGAAVISEQQLETFRILQIKDQSAPINKENIQKPGCLLPDNFEPLQVNYYGPADTVVDAD